MIPPGMYILQQITLPDQGEIVCHAPPEADRYGICQCWHVEVRIVLTGVPVPVRVVDGWVEWFHLPNYGPPTSDIDGDHFINGDDYDLFTLAFEVGCECADSNGDGFVNADDLDLFRTMFENGE